MVTGRTKKKKIEFTQVHLSNDFVRMFDIKRKIEQPKMDRISFSKMEADRMEESIFKKKRKNRGIFDDFKI